MPKSLPKYIISFALLILSGISNSEEITFSMNCEILDQVILETEDGKAKRYSKFTDGNQIGDAIQFSFNYESNSPDSYSIQFRSAKANSFMRLASLNKTYHSVEGAFVVLERYGGSIFFGDDLFTSKAPDSGISGKRYYKNDWSFSLHTHMDQTVFVQSLNCMSMPPAYQKILSKMIAFHE